MYICIAYIRVIDGIIKNSCTMKTLMNQIKNGTLLTCLIFLSSCTGDARINSEILSNSASPAVYVKMHQGEGENLTLYYSYSSKSKDEHLASLRKDAVRSNYILNVLPISFGGAEAALVSN
jgi:hypothetical protein